MIAGIFYEGSGIGNQLFRYITTRTLALDKGYDFGMIDPENFKGKGFMNLDMGINCEKWELDDFGYNEWNEKKVIENGVDIRGYDPEINFVEDSTVIEGEFQDERYWGHRLPEIREWLKFEPLEISENLCVINFRGGEYKLYPDLFLTKDYWDKAIEMMLSKYKHLIFQVHTDDPKTAFCFFPNFEIIENTTIAHSLNTNMGYNWRALRYAKHIILSNSSFGILPSLLNEDVKEVIAPRYWARRNTKVWALPQNFYKKFTYI